MSLWKLATASLRHFWRTNLALLLGIAIGTAVLTGALIVGDSIRHSLKTLTIERLGHIEEILIGEHFFRADLADQLAATTKSDPNKVYTNAVPAILINQSTIELISTSNTTARTQGVSLVGANADFWDLSTTELKVTPPGQDDIIINQALADDLGAKIGDEIVLHVGKASSIASDSALARKSDLVKTITDLKIVNIIPATGLGRFSLQASQQVPANAFVALETLQDGLDQEDKINAVLISRRDETPASDDAFKQLTSTVKPSIEDLGLKLKRVSLGYTEGGETKTVLAYDTLTNDRMLFAPEHDSLIDASLKSWNAQPSYTYLATKMQRLDANGQLVGDIVPYSTITGIDSRPSLGPLMKDDKPIALADDEIALNNWTATAMGAKVGEMVRVTFFEPETTHGDVVEQSAEFRLVAIVPITEPDRPFDRRGRDARFVAPPTLANDPDLTPQVKGITDAESINQWDAPFPMDRTLLNGRDDDYWLYYRTTPKAFVSLAAGRKLWASRFGDTTSYRIPIDSQNTNQDLEARGDALSTSLGKDYEQFGMHWIRAKSDGLKASSGTTPFDVLFFLFSQFIIASALMLVALLLRLGLEQRASQIGLVGALGFDNKRSFRVLLAENGLIILLGSLLGVLLGIVYAWLMLAGLRTWWVDAVVTPFMQLNVSPTSLIVGFLMGVVASLLTVIFTLRQLRKVPVSALMSGSTDVMTDKSTNKTSRAWLGWLPYVLLAAALLLSVSGKSLPTEQQGGVFFGSGALALIAMLMAITFGLRRRGAQATDGAALNANSLAVRNLTRNPTRSALTIGLVASACFLIVALSAFRLSPTDGGTGGFDLIGISDQPIFETFEDDELPADTKIFSLRMQDGDDASCRNLYQSKKPRLIGITQDFIDNADDIGKMDWAGVDGLLSDEDSKWRALSSDFVPTGSDDGSDAIPVVLDKNTAMYAMQIYTGVGTVFERDYGASGILKFRIVGLLAGSTFQGSLLVPEKQLLVHFPRVGGYRYFMIDSPESSEVSNKLEENYSDEGLDLTDSNRLLTELLAVQNTYLSTFQSLGGLGLLLGTFGLAAVQLRNVVQRRGELALLRAAGFRNQQLSLLVLREHAMLLFGGLAVGIAAAFLVVFPHMLFGGASVPIGSLLVMLGLVAIVGLASAFFAQRYLQKMPLLPALRGD